MNELVIEVQVLKRQTEDLAGTESRHRGNGEHDTVRFACRGNNSPRLVATQQLAENSQLTALIQATSVRAPIKFFAVVSQIAPTGGEYLEDLSLLDGTDSRQWLLAIAVRRGIIHL